MNVLQDISALSHKQIQIVHSANDYVREAGSSGGFVSELLRYLFKTNQINATVSYRFSGPSLFVPELVFNVENYNQTGSIYHEVGLVPFLKNNIDKIKGDVAIVCLPCQCKVIRKLLAQAKHKVIIISLTCSSQSSKEATYVFLCRHSININQVNTLQYRGHGWPSGVQVEMKDGKYFFFSLTESDFIPFHKSPIYTLNRCFQCSDTFGMDADFIIADPWIKRYVEQDRVGNSVVVLNSERAETIFKKMLTAERIVLKEEISLSEFFSSQKWSVQRKALYRTSPHLKWVTKFYKTAFYKCLYFRFPKLLYRIHNKMLRYLSRKLPHD